MHIQLPTTEVVSIVQPYSNMDCIHKRSGSTNALNGRTCNSRCCRRVVSPSNGIRPSLRSLKLPMASMYLHSRTQDGQLQQRSLVWFEQLDRVHGEMSSSKRLYAAARWGGNMLHQRQSRCPKAVALLQFPLMVDGDLQRNCSGHI